MAKPYKSVIIVVVLLTVIATVVVHQVYNERYGPCYTRYAYADSSGNLEVTIRYPHTDITNDEILRRINESAKVTDFLEARTVEHYGFTLRNTTLTTEELSRFRLSMRIQRDDLPSGLIFSLTYTSPFEHTSYVHDEESRDEFFNKVDEFFTQDNDTIMEYIGELHSVVSPIVGHGFSYDYEEIYNFDKCCSKKKGPC